MSYVTFTYKDGRTRRMSQRDANLLQRMRRGTVAAETPAAPPAPSAVDLDAMDDDALRALAKDLGVKVHHKAGADKLRAALREASA